MNFRPEFRSYPTRGRKFKKTIPKKFKKNSKIKKTTFRRYFQPKRDEIGGEREKKKNLDPNSVHTRPVEGNFEKNS